MMPHAVARAMVAGRLPQRVRGEGWEVWLDDEGFLWTRDTRPLDRAAAEVRLSAMERFLSRRPVRGVIVDDREPAGADSEAAYELYGRFVEAHPALPVAVVTTHGPALGFTRQARGGARLAVFQTEESARVWLRSQNPSPEPVCTHEDALRWLGTGLEPR